MRTLISEYQTITSKITRIEERILAVYSAAASAKIKTISDMPMSPSFNNNGLDAVFIQIEKLTENKHNLETKRACCATNIETKLKLAGISGIARDIFWYREVYGKKWCEISRLTKKSVRQLQRIYQKTIYMSLLL